MRNRCCCSIALAVIAGMLVVLAARAVAAAPLYDTPVYNPDTKSYFELVLIRTTKYSYRNSPDVNWPQAFELAKSRSYKGAQGRLAVVRDLATHEFLMRTFKTETPTWIGLRWWCADHKLQFVDGKMWSRGTFQAWDAKWDHSGVQRCEEYQSYKKPEFMPVAYSPVQEGFRWFAQGWHKAYYAYFVEYPTGHP